MKLLEKIKIDLIVNSRDRYKEAILSLLEKNEDARVLDLGCGDPKRLVNRVRERVNCNPIYGIDLTDEHADINTLIVKEDLNNFFPFTDEMFDAVIASQIIEHLWNTDGFLKEIKRVLKPGGYAIISTPNLASWHNLVYLCFGKQPDVATVSDELYPWKEKPGHRRVFTATELIKLLRFHGFTIEKVIGSSYYPLTRKLANWLARKDYKHAGNITVKVRRTKKRKDLTSDEYRAIIKYSNRVVDRLVGELEDDSSTDTVKD